jgi:hypothetical protein
MLVSIELGYRIGVRRRAQDRQNSIEVIGTVDAAVFGLLGLILAFTFSGASDRLVVRRAQIVQETNAIETAYLRLALIDATAQPAIKSLFREYLEARIEVFDKFLDRPASQAALQKSERLQDEIWSKSVTACRAEPKVDACLLLLPALNEMIDITTTRSVAAQTHAPLIVLAMMVFLSLAAAMLSGYAMSAQHTRSVLHIVLFSLVVAGCIYVVLDLEYPRAGLINLRSADTALQQVRDAMKY